MISWHNCNIYFNDSMNNLMTINTIKNAILVCQAEQDWLQDWTKTYLGCQVNPLFVSQRVNGSWGQFRCSTVGRRLLASSGRGEDVAGAGGRELVRGRDHVHLVGPRSDQSVLFRPMCKCTANVDKIVQLHLSTTTLWHFCDTLVTSD